MRRLHYDSEIHAHVPKQQELSNMKITTLTLLLRAFVTITWGSFIVIIAANPETDPWQIATVAVGAAIIALSWRAYV
jgi:hypothetical protein